MTAVEPRQLRAHQQEAVHDIHSVWATGATRVAIVHPVGSGKTDVISAICLSEINTNPDSRVLVLAHRSELLDQLTERIALYSNIPVGRIQADRNDMNFRVITASVQTLRQPSRRTRLDAADWQPTLVIIDEVHHGLAKSFVDIMEWAGCFDDRKTKLLGVTATLIRGDGQSFDSLFQSIADVRSLDWAFSHHLLSKPVIKPIALDKPWDRLFEMFRHLSPGELQERDDRRTVQGWLRKAQNRITIAYATDVKHAKRLVSAFQTEGVAAELVIGTTPYEDRKLIYKKLAAGDIRVMVNVGVATEGFDIPQVSCIILARNTQSPGLVQQIIGRGMRLCIDSETGKPWKDPVTGRVKINCLVLDTTGAAQQFDMSTLIDIRDVSRIRREPTRLQKIWQLFRSAL